MKTLIFVLALVLSSCGILSKNHEKLNVKRRLETWEVKQLKQRYTETAMWMVVDSSQQHTAVLIRPKGLFTYGPNKGFEGEAEQVFISNKLNKQIKIDHIKEIHRDSSQLHASYKNEQVSRTMDKKAKFKVNFSWSWIVIIPILYLIYRSLKLLNK